jgi:hypothetical protein
MPGNGDNLLSNDPPATRPNPHVRAHLQIQNHHFQVSYSKFNNMLWMVTTFYILPKKLTAKTLRRRGLFGYCVIAKKPGHGESGMK